MSWSILLEAGLSTAPSEEDIRDRLRAATERYPHLGTAPAVETTCAARLPEIRAHFAAAPYERGEPLLRVARCTDEPTVLVAAHHGAIDGMGLLAVLGLVLDVQISSGARGIGARAADRSFLASAVRRLVEALFAPPARIRPAAAGPASGDVFVVRRESRMRFGTADLVAAAAHATERWNGVHGASRVVAAIGACNSGGAAPRPVRDSSFFRLRLPPAPTSAEVGEMLAAQPPEPAFPARSSVVARLGTRLLARRLGSTFLVSNLGVVSAPDVVRSISFYPAASGRSGVAFGAVTVGETSTVTVRARHGDFDDAAAGRLADGLLLALRGQDSRSRSG